MYIALWPLVISVAASFYFLFDEDTGRIAKTIFVLLSVTAILLQFSGIIEVHFLVPLGIQVFLSIWAVLVWQFRGE